MTGRTFALITVSAFFSLMISMRIENRAAEMFSFILMVLPAAAIISQSEVK